MIAFPLGYYKFLKNQVYIFQLNRCGTRFEVIDFEGQGQGNVIIKQGIPLDYRWERRLKQFGLPEN
jgi:hypothetical protein